MKNITCSKIQTLLILLLGVWAMGYSQTKDFNAPRWNNNGVSVKGDFVAIGNNFLTFVRYRESVDGIRNNGDKPMERIDIDGDGTYYSAATLSIPTQNTACKQIKWAGLYWASFYRNRKDDHRNLHWVTPDGKVRHDQADETIARNDFHYYNFKDVTDIIKALPDANGEYKVSGRYSTPQPHWSSSGGWALFVVYEDPDPSVIARKISIFDGYKSVGGRQDLDIDVRNFQTIPSGPVNAKLGAVTLEGDRIIEDDQFRIKNPQGWYVELGQGAWPNDKNNFFDSNITLNGNIVTSRRPAHNNTVGWDIDIFQLPNAGNSIITNNQTSTTLNLFTDGDQYNLFVTAFSVETISPIIELEKSVKGKDANGNWVSFLNQGVGYGKELIYEMRFRNVGNDDAVSGEFIDIFPANVNLVKIENTPAGVTPIAEEDVVIAGATRKKVTFRIDDSLLKKQTSRWSDWFRFKVQVVPDCKSLRDVCSNEIQNQAFIRYKTALDVQNLGAAAQYEPEVGSFTDEANCAKEPTPTNFLFVDPKCNEAQEVILCGTQTILSAGAGYATYTWRKQGETTILGNGQDLNVTQEGTYEVTKEVYPQHVYCQNPLKEIFVVRYDGNQAINPLLKYATQHNRPACGNDGKVYVQIPLCANTKLLDLSGAYPAGTLIKWHKYNGVRPPVNQLPETCPVPKTNANTALWQELHQGTSYNVTNEGEYAVEVVFNSNKTGVAPCSQFYYFRVHRSNYTYNVTNAGHFLCGAQGKIELSGITGQNQQYKIMKGNTVIIDWTDVDNPATPAVETSLVYTIPTPHTGGVFKTFVRQKMQNPQLQANVCEYEKEIEIPDINIENEVTIQKTDVLCTAQDGNTGRIRIITSTRIQPYTIVVKRGNNAVVTYNNISDTQQDNAIDQTLSHLPEGTYVVEVHTPTSVNTPCLSKNVVIEEVPSLEIVAVGSDGVSCGAPDERKINITLRGGTLIPSGAGTYGFLVYHGAGYTQQIDLNNVTHLEKARANVTINGKTYPQITYELTIQDPWGVNVTEKSYKVEVADANNCSADTEVLVRKIQPKYRIETLPADCDLNAGKITFVLEDPNLATQYNIRYSIRKKNINDTWGNWEPYQTSEVFTGLVTGEYQTRIEYSIGQVKCYYPADIQKVTDQNGQLVDPNPIPEEQRPIVAQIGDGGGPVKAFVGVIRLACATSNAKVRVANISGGEPISATTPYQIKLNGGAWGDVREFDLPPGEHTIQVRGKNLNCAPTYKIRVQDPITPPNIVPTLTYDCEGKVSVSLQNDNPKYEYSYEQTGASVWHVGDNYTLPNKLDASTTIRVKYKEIQSATSNVLIREDFGQGDPLTSSQGMTPLYTPIDPRRQRLEWNKYFVAGTRDITYTRRDWWRDQCTFPNDHTDRNNTAGRYLAIDFGTLIPNGAIFFEKDVKDVIPNKPIEFEMYGYNLVRAYNCTRPVMIMEIVALNPDGSVVQERGQDKVLGRIQSQDIPENGGDPNKWFRFSSDGTGVDRNVTPVARVNPGNYQNLRIRIRTKHNTTSCNDFAFDDIYVYQEPESCDSFVEVPIHVEADKAFDFDTTTVIQKDVSCHGGFDGSYLIRLKNTGATYKYRILKGNTQYIPTAGTYATTSDPLIQLNSLSKARYRIEIKFDDTTPACDKRLDFDINEPDELKVAPSALATNFYLNCQENNRIVKLTDLMTPPQGGTPPYSYFVTKNGLEQAVDNQGNIILSLGVYNIEVRDTRACNTATSRKTITFEVKQRQLPTLTLNRVACATNTGTDIRAVVTPNVANVASNFTYYIKQNKPSVTGYVINNDNLFRNLLAGEYTIKVTDQYNCSVEQDVEVFDVLSATISVRHKSKCNSVENQGNITITPVNGSGDFEYAFLTRTGQPTATDYVTTNTQDYPYSQVTQVVYVWVRDKVTGCTFSVREEVRGTPETLYNVTAINPHCQGDFGSLNIVVQQGAPTYTLVVTDANAQEVSRYDNSNETNFVVNNLEEGEYTIVLTDANGCRIEKTQRIEAPVLEATITDLNKSVPGTCNPDKSELGFSIDKTPATTSAGYTLLYSKDNGLTWQVSNEFLGIDAGTQVFPSIGRFPAGTLVDATGKPSLPIYCKTDMGAYITKIIGGVEIDYTTGVTSTGGACATSYSVKVRMGGNVQYFEVAYALDSKDNTADWKVATGDQATGYEYTFQNLVPGRQYIVYARYKTSAGVADYCYSSTSIDLAQINVPTSGLKAVAESIPMCDAGATLAGIRFALSGGNNTTNTISWQLMKIDGTTGAETQVTTLIGNMPVIDNPKMDNQPYDTNNGKIITINNIPIGGNDLYYLKIKDASNCVIGSNSVNVVYTPANAIQANPTAPTMNCEGSIMILSNASGGTNSGFVYRVPKEDTTGTQVLRRDIRSTNNLGVELRLDDFTPAFLATNPSQVTLHFVVIDRITSCFVEKQVVVNIAPKPQFTVEVENNCTLPYRIKIIPNTGQNTIGNYEYSIDGGVIYTTSNVIPVPEGFKKGQVRIRDKATRCVGAIEMAQANDVVIFPAFIANARITQEPTACNGTATLTIQVQNGSKDYQYIVTPKSTGVAQPAVDFNSISPNGSTNHQVALNSGDTYTIQVIDKNLVGNCNTKVFDNIAVETTQTIVATTEQRDVSCHGLNNGEIIVKLEKASHKQGPYQAVMQTPPAGVTQTEYQSPTHFGWVFGNLPKGNYQIAITSKYNCQTDVNPSIDEPNAPLTGNILNAETDTHFTCTNPLGANKVRLTLEAQGGTAPYKFSVDGGNTWFDEQVAGTNKRTFTITDNGTQQTIDWKIIDSKGCQPVEGTYTIETRTKVIAPITGELAVRMDCERGEQVQLTINSNKPSTYTIDIPAEPTFVPVVTTLAGASVQTTIELPQKAGVYTLRITDNATGCEYNSVPYVVKEVEKPIVTAVAYNTCNPNVSNEVKIYLTLQGNIGTGYDYKVLKGGIQKIQGTESADRVEIVFNDPIDPATGTYDVIVKMVDTKCEITTFTEVVQAENQINIEVDVVKHISYNCDITPPRPNTDGIIAIKNPVVGGWGPKYQYLLVKDGNDVGIWSERTRFENLEPNATYQIKVKDSNDCEAISLPIQLDAPQQITSNGGISTTPVSCFGANDGTISLTQVQGGSGKYSYTLVEATTGLPITTSKDNMGVVGSVRFDGLFAGEYIIRVSDQLFECTKPFELPGEITSPDQLKAIAKIDTFADCNTDGAIVIEAVGANGNYQYQRIDDHNNPIGTLNTTGVFPISHTTSETYKFLVTSGTCRAYTNVIAIDKIEPLSIQVKQTISKLKCSGDAAGRIVVEAKGGSTDATKSYVYTLVDNMGTPINGVPTNLTGVFTNLVAGTYKVKVEQNGGTCTPALTNAITIEENPVYTATAIKTDVRCNGNNDGTYTITADLTARLLDGSQRTLEYAISPRLDRFKSVQGNKIQLTDLAPGVYTLIVQDQNGCRPTILDAMGNPIDQDIFEFTIIEPPIFNVSIVPGSLIHEGCLGASDAEVKLNITGGRPYQDAVTGALYYEYSLTGNTTDFHRYDTSVGIVGLPSGDHTIWVRDENGCNPIEVKIPTIEPGADLQATHKLIYTCNGTEDISNRVTINVNPKEIANVVYRLGAPDATPRNNPVFVFPAVPAGQPPVTYDIYVESDRRNHKKCVQKITIQLEHKPALTWQPSNITHVLCNGDNTGQIVASVTGGSGQYEYAISPNEEQFGKTSTFSNLTAGVYHIIAKDIEYDCLIRQAIKIEEPEALNILNLTEKGITCSGKIEGKVSFNVEGGKKFSNIPNLLHQYKYRVYKEDAPTEVYDEIIEIEEPAGSPKKVQIIKLPPGRYKLEVEDANGCKVVRDVQIDNAPDLQPEEVRLFYTCGVLPQYGEAPSQSKKATYEIWVKFRTTKIDKDLIKYSLNNGTPKKFSRYESHNVAVIGEEAGVPLSLPDGKYEITLYYDDCASILGTNTFEINNHNPLSIEEITLPNEMNKLQVQVSGGKAPYKLYFANPKYEQIIELTSVYNEMQELDLEKGKNQAIAKPYIIQRGDYGQTIDGKEIKTIRVYVEDALGCGYYVDIQKRFYDIDIPNYFTPNKDGVNDFWYPRNIETYPNASIQIIDRYGRFITKIKPGEGWDGLYNGRELPAGDYWYIIDMNEPDDKRVFKGHFTLYR